MSMEEIHDLLDDFRLSITTRGRPLLESIVVISVAAVIWKGWDTKGIRDAEAGLVASYMPTNGGFCENLLKWGFTPVILVWIRLKTCFLNLIYLLQIITNNNRVDNPGNCPRPLAGKGWIIHWSKATARQTTKQFFDIHTQVTTTSIPNPREGLPS